MTRPSRYPGVSLVKLEAYVHPDAAKELERRADGRPIGLVLDRMLGVGSGPDVAFCAPTTQLYDLRLANKPARAAQPHLWKDHPTFGKVCGTCKKPKKTAEGTNCVPIDENQPEEAHLTQKGPK